MARKKAVAYVRVSSKSDAQAKSYLRQEEYWQTELTKHPDMKFCGLYADFGISGKFIAKRPRFLEMIRDAKEGRIDVIFTKSVQRFGRNTTEMLQTVRELRDCGVKVIFEKEQIDTFQPNSELYLTIAASVAENDLKVYSENQRWSYKDRFSKGYITFGNKIYGYSIDWKNNTLIPNPEQAEVVREIFDLYLRGYGLTAIGRILESEGRPNIQGKPVCCANCGSKFRRFGRKLADGTKVPTWVCIQHQKESDKCDMLPLKESDVYEAYKRAVERLSGDFDEIIATVKQNADEVLNGDGDAEKGQDAAIMEYQQRILDLFKAHREDRIGEEEYANLYREYSDTVRTLEAERDRILTHKNELRLARHRLQDIAQILSDRNRIDITSPSIIKILVERITVQSKTQIEIVFKCGIKIKETIA